MAAGAVQLRLYVLAGSHRSSRALRNLRTLMNEVEHDVELEVIDVAADPGRASSDRVAATPTLIRRTGGREERVVGDLSAHDLVRPMLRPRGGRPLAR